MTSAELRHRGVRIGKNQHIWCKLERLSVSFLRKVVDMDQSDGY